MHLISQTYLECSQPQKNSLLHCIERESKACLKQWGQNYVRWFSALFMNYLEAFNKEIWKKAIPRGVKCLAKDRTMRIP